MSDTILVVDDDQATLRLVQHILERNGFAVITASSGTEALSKTQTAKPDLVILDVMMPDMSGIEVCQRLRENPETMNLPIIMLSARGQVAAKISGLEAGADEYITKPVPAAELVVRVKALLERTRRLLQGKSTKSGGVFGFVGAKGGVGTSTVALNIAASLANRGESVIATELGYCFGSLALQLQETASRNLSDLLDLDTERITRKELATRLYKLTPNLKLLFGPQKLSEFEQIQPEQAKTIIRVLSQMSRYTIVDLPNYPFGVGPAIIQHFDFVSLVLEPDPMCVQAAKPILKLVRAWGPSDSLMGAIVVNRVPPTIPVALADIQSELGCNILGVVPHAAELFITARRLGKPIVLYQPSSIAAASLAEIATKLTVGT